MMYQHTSALATKYHIIHKTSQTLKKQMTTLKMTTLNHFARLFVIFAIFRQATPLHIKFFEEQNSTGKIS